MNTGFKKAFLFSSVSVFFLLSSLNTFAATASGVVRVTATLGSGCQVNAANIQNGIADFGALNFGSINTLNDLHIDGQTTGTGNGSIEVECSNGTPFSISLDDGINHDGSSRGMAHNDVPGEVLRYALYKDAGRTQAWTSDSPLQDTSTGGAQLITIYGRIPGGQSGLSSGTYQDTVQVTINW